MLRIFTKSYIRLLSPIPSHLMQYTFRGAPTARIISFSWLCLTAHELAIETGRWNKRGRGRLLVEKKLCYFGAVQAEVHVIKSGPSRSMIEIGFTLTQHNNYY